jgi:hypothetical protein
MDSPKILEAKMLYFYGLILLNLLSTAYPELSGLIKLLNDKCKNLEEFGKMQYVFDCIEDIEKAITSCLINDDLISILIECLLSPYKAKIVFDDFYEKKNFLNEAIQSRLDKYNKDNAIEETKAKTIKKENMNNIINKSIEKSKAEIEEKFDADKETMLMPYFLNNEKNEKKNEDSTKDCLTINKLLIHPFYSDIELTESFLKYIFKTENVKKEDKPQ